MAPESKRILTNEVVNKLHRVRIANIIPGSVSVALEIVSTTISNDKKVEKEIEIQKLYS